MNNAITKTTTAPTTANVLQSLRSLIPERVVTFPESLRIAERQASRLRQLLEATDAPTPSQAIAALPHIRVEYVRDLPSGGLSFWDGQQWIIQLSTRHTPARQRLSLLHHYKHIIDHGAAPRLYGGGQRQSADAEAMAEGAADHFAAFALDSISRRSAQPAALAAVDVRLDKPGLRAPTRQCIWLVTPRHQQTNRRAIRQTTSRRSATTQLTGTA